MDNLAELIDECVELELNVAGIYTLFHFAIPEDAEFWWQLHQEERNYADLLRSINETFLPADVYPDNLMLPSLETLKKTNTRLCSLLEKYRNHPPERDEAFLVALEIENSAGEIHFQKFTATKSMSKIDKVFQELIRDDKDHAQRIMLYMLDRGFQPPKI